MAGGVTNPIMPGGYALAGKWARAPLGGLDLEDQPAVLQGIGGSQSPPMSPHPSLSPITLSSARLVPDLSSPTSLLSPHRAQALGAPTVASVWPLDNSHPAPGHSLPSPALCGKLAPGLSRLPWLCPLQGLRPSQGP